MTTRQTIGTPQGRAAVTLLQALAQGDPDAVRGLFAGPAEIDDPFHGRHVDGGFETMVRSWAPAHLATIKRMELTHSTVQGPRSAAEVTLSLERGGEAVDLYVVVVSDHAPDGSLQASRLYYRRAVVDGRQHHRRPIVDPRSLPPLNPVLQAYQTALGAGDAEGMIATFGPGFHLDGHGQDQDMSKGLGMGRYDLAEVSAALRQMFDLNSAGATTLEKLNVIDDGVTTAIEFNLYQGVPEDPEPRNHAGVAVYEMGPDGRLLEARVYDEAW
jgi:hypothetical protein